MEYMPQEVYDKYCKHCKQLQECIKQGVSCLEVLNAELNMQKV